MTDRKALEPPPGYRFDPFADVRLGKSLFQMEPGDWLVPIEANPEAATGGTP